MIEVFQNSHFSMFSVAPASLMRFSTAKRRTPCCVFVLPKLRTSSIWHTIHSRLAKIPLFHLWKCSSVLENPNGNIFKLNLWNGVINVVRRRDTGESNICQNPLFASNLVNILASVSCARVLSYLGSGWTSLRTLL